MLFGGADHDVYLGCLNCSEFATDSVYDEFGKYGSRFSDQSIFDYFGEYGSEFSNTSPCNEFASNPPAIVDQNGNFYGYLTKNDNNPKQVKHTKLFMLIGGRVLRPIELMSVTMDS